MKWKLRVDRFSVTATIAAGISLWCWYMEGFGIGNFFTWCIYFWPLWFTFLFIAEGILS